MAISTDAMMEPGIEIDAGKIMLKGDITLYAVENLYDQGLKHFSTLEQIVVDLSDVNKFDHALPALLLAWRTEARRSDKCFKIKALSKDFLMLTNLSGVDDILLDCRMN